MIQRIERQFAGRNLTVETGRMARQAAGSCLIQFGETVILIAATARDHSTHLPFFPLTVEYREKSYAAGKIPGGFFKREGRPGEKEILSCRLIDRSLRPMFPDGFMHETQVACFPLSADQENDADVWGIMGASLSLNMSNIPFSTLLAAVRIGRVQGNWIMNPTFQQLEYSDLDIVVTGTQDALLMVEGGAVEVSESDILEGLEVAHEGIRELIEIQKAFLSDELVPDMEWTPVLPDEELRAKVEKLADSRVAEALQLAEKQERNQAMAAVKEDVLAQVAKEDENYAENQDEIKEILRGIEKKTMRERILSKGERADGRKVDEVRPITCEIGILPRTHG